MEFLAYVMRPHFNRVEILLWLLFGPTRLPKLEPKIHTRLCCFQSQPYRACRGMYWDLEMVSQSNENPKTKTVGKQVSSPNPMPPLPKQDKTDPERAGYRREVAMYFPR